MASGIDQQRLSLLLAVMEKRAGLNLLGDDVYVNVAGGMTVDEPAADLGVVAAVASSVRNRPVGSSTAVFGEVGLGGEVRAITQPALRVREAARMGFERCIVPLASADLPKSDRPAGMRAHRRADSGRGFTSATTMTVPMRWDIAQRVPRSSQLIAYCAFLLRPLGASPLANVAFGVGIAGLVVFLEGELRQTPLANVIGALIGGTVGLLLARLIGDAHFWAERRQPRRDFSSHAHPAGAAVHRPRARREVG